MDESKLRYLIENHADYGLKHDRKVKGKPCGDYIARLQKYLDSDRIITYAQSRGHGRMFATQPLSLQSMCKRVRHTICKDLMIDVDMVNAHPTSCLYSVTKMVFLVLNWIFTILILKHV